MTVTENGLAVAGKSVSVTASTGYRFENGAAFPSGDVDATVSTDSTAVGTLLTLDPSGGLRKGTNPVATGVTSAFAELDRNNAESVTWVDGSC